MTFQLLDAVRLTEDVPEEGLRRGATGAIVEIFTQPETAYEVEFVDSEGATLWIGALRPHQLEPFD